jgi:hypothetical protein
VLASLGLLQCHSWVAPIGSSKPGAVTVPFVGGTDWFRGWHRLVPSDLQSASPRSFSGLIPRTLFTYGNPMR